MTMSSAQIAAQLDAVLARDQKAQAVAIRASAKADWPASITRRGRVFDIRWCESRLSMREALDQHDSDQGDAERGLLVLTPLGDGEVPNDIAARLARGRVFQPQGWDTVRQLFQAQATDARLGRYDWMPAVLIEAAGADGFSPVPSGFLDLESAWREVLQRCLQIGDLRPDAVSLLRWGMRPDVQVLLGRLPPKAQTDALAWLASNGGAAAGLIVRCIQGGRAQDAAPLGIVCDVLFHGAAEGVASLAQAVVRLERYVGDQHVAVSDGRLWSAQAKRLAELLAPEDLRPVLERADDLLSELRVADHAHLSDWLPSGLDQRLERAADAVTAYLRQPGDAGLAAAEEALQAALAHRLIAQQPLRAERVRMAARLLRWMHRSAPPPSGLAALAGAQADEGAFIDWARFRLLGGDELPKWSAALRELRAAAQQRRDGHNKTFAAALAAQLREASTTAPRALPVEDILNRAVGPLAASHPVLLLVVDGLSLSIFRELFDRPERLGWSEWMPSDADRPLVGLAALPTVTEVSRTSLLLGRVALGNASAEKTGFAAHTALTAVSSAAHPPVLFHKRDLDDGGSLAAEVRTALANPSQRVVGVVYNAVDDHLSGPDQLHQRWSLEDLRLILPILKEARDSRRVVVVTADHGHVLEDGSSAMPGGESDRWRGGTSAAAAAEVALSGSRVLAPGGGDKVVCLWSETARYTGRKNGYHGGASPAEVVVPLSVFAPLGLNLPGWKLAPPQQPDWWDAATPLRSPERPATPVPRQPARKAAAAPANQGGLFADNELPVPAPSPASAAGDWIASLLGSAVYASQRQLAARVALPDDQMRRLLHALDERGGKLSRAALAQRMGVAELRLGGLLSASRRMLNVDQAPILSVDEASGTVELNRVLLVQQFQLPVNGGAR